MSLRRFKGCASLIVWLLPSCGIKMWALRRLGNEVGTNVSIGPNLVLSCGPFTIGDGTVIMNFNVFRRLAGVDLAPKSCIGHLNQFTAAIDYQVFSPLVGRLVLGELAMITNRHYFDCSGQIILKPYAGIGGIRSIFQSHEIDLVDDETTIGRVVIGERAMTCTACVLLRDSYLPERSVLAAGSLLTKSRDDDAMPTSGLYGGVPARFIRNVSDDNLTRWNRKSYNTSVTWFDDERFRLD